MTECTSPVAERILGLCKSIFRVDSVLLHLRDGNTVFARPGDTTFNEELRRTACNKLAPPDKKAAACEDLDADARRAPSTSCQPAGNRSDGAQLGGGLWGSSVKNRMINSPYADQEGSPSFASMESRILECPSVCNPRIPAKGIDGIFACCRLKDAPEVRAALQYFAGSPLVAPNGYRLGSM